MKHVLAFAMVVALVLGYVGLRGVRLVSAPLAFRLPRLRRFDGFATLRIILVRRLLSEVSDDLVVHELCHVWQMQLSLIHISEPTRPY